MGVVDDSPLRNPDRIPYSVPPPPSQSQADAAEEEETTSMRELVQEIDTHVDLKVTSNLNVADDAPAQQPSTKDIPSQPTDEAAQFPPTDPVV